MLPVNPVTFLPKLSRTPSPPRGGLRLLRLTSRALPIYLDGRPRDPRVKYCAVVNAGKQYPDVGKRQRTRIARQAINARIRALDATGASDEAYDEARWGMLRQLGELRRA